MQPEQVATRADVSLAEAAATIARAADLATGQPLDHIVRSCAIAWLFADHLGISSEDRVATYWVSLLMISGCSAVSFELSQLFGDEIAVRGAGYDLGPSTIEQARFVFGHAGGGRPLPEKTRVRLRLLGTRLRPFIDSILAHCSVNARLAERLGLSGDVRDALQDSFAQWNGKGIPAGVRGGDIPLPVRISTLADLVEASFRERGVDGAIDIATTWRGISLDPELVDAWCEMAPGILEAADGDAAWDLVRTAPPNRTLSTSEVDTALELIADYADLKSPWFTGHSRAVADRTEAAARELGVPETDVETARRAALLHDLGRASVPNSIWDKPSPLNEDEWERVRLHAYFTDRIVRRGMGLATLAPIAASAHERVDGGGYPRGIAGETIPLLGRIVAAADRFQAMREDRPHRPALDEKAAVDELHRMGREGELDPLIADAVLAGEGHPRRRTPSGPAGLTPREIEVLVLAARGSTTRQIARALGITPKTAGNHIEHIYAKIGISSRAEAAMFAMQHRLVGAEDR
ncbi:MAG TPA: HD domain-containing phosphohydrolase [Actinomycetota bacterium]|nr:HD domain-containing phosphohydrolase [Actinomycetota bacterium]